MKHFVIAAALVLAAAPALSQTQAQKNAINHAAQAFMGAERCGSIVANRATILLMLLNIGVDITQPRFEAEMTARLREANRGIANVNRQDVCAATLMLYGPNGSNVPGFVQQK